MKGKGAKGYANKAKSGAQALPARWRRAADLPRDDKRRKPGSSAEARRPRGGDRNRRD